MDRRTPNFLHTRLCRLRRLENVKILLVEDHDDSRSTLASLLTHCGHAVVAAKNVHDGLRMLVIGSFDVLLSDLSLPDGDGLDLVKAARTRQPGIRTVALTGRDSADDHQLGQNAGFDHYLTKPFDFHELRAVLSAES
jgi:DNA-binding response OmpR family regulator